MKDSDVQRTIQTTEENLMKAADIHAGDGGYSESTKEAYDAFVKERNKPTLYLIRGLPGSGKSALASILNRCAVTYLVDQHRKDLS